MRKLYTILFVAISQTGVFAQQHSAEVLAAKEADRLAALAATQDLATAMGSGCNAGFTELFFEDFESGQPAGWTFTTTDGGSWTFDANDNGVAGPVNGNWAVVNDDDNDDIGVAVATSPVINAAGNDVTVSFYYDFDAFGADADLFVEFFDGSAWQFVDPANNFYGTSTVFCGDDCSGTVTLTADAANFGNADFQFRITFNDNASYSWGLGFDDVRVCVATGVPFAAINVVKTVAIEDGNGDCNDDALALTNSISVNPGDQVCYFYYVENTGGISLNLHDVEDDVLGTLVTALPYALDPASAAFLPVGPVTMNSTVTNTVTWTAYNVGPTDIATGQASATVTVIPPAPSNDLCVDAIAVTCGQTVSGSTTDATATGASACDSDGLGVWYSIIGDGSDITLDLSNSNYDTYLGVTQSCGGACFDSDDDGGTGTTSLLTFSSVNGQTYYIYISGFGTATGDYEMSISCVAPPTPPANDLCVDAETIVCGDVLTGSTALATADTEVSGDCDSPVGTTGNGVWYEFQGNGQDVTFSTCSPNTTFDTEINVYTGNCGALTCEAFNDDDSGCSFSGLRSTVSFFATAGVTYYIRVSYWSSSNASSGAFELSATCNCTADAGTITADATPVCLNGPTTISATHDANSTVPTGYVQAYALTDAATLTVLQVGLTPSFTVTTGGDYIIHTIVYDPLQVDPTTLPPGTTGFDINAILIQGGGTMCGSLDVAGAPITVLGPDAGTITADATPVCIEDGGLISATPDGNQVVPAGYVQGYALTQGGTILQVGASPSFTVGAVGTYVIHTVVYDPAGLDPSLAIGLPAAVVNAQLVQGGGTVCASLDLTGATIVVESCVPVNDLCVNAIPVACNDVVSGSTANATSTDASDCDADGIGVWYSFVGDGSVVTLDLSNSDYDTYLSVTESCGGACFASDDDGGTGLTSLLSFPSVSAQTYYIYISGFGAATGNYELSVSCVPPAANDNVCDAIGLSLGANGPFSVLGATAETGEPVPGAGTGATSCESQDGWCGGDLAVQNSVWFTFVAPASGTVTVNTDGSYDTQIAVYEAASCASVTSGGATLLGANDDNPDATTLFTSELIVCGLTAGETYFLQVDGFLADEGDLSITLSEPLVTAFSSSATNLDVAFTDASTSDAGIATWAWDFGDGSGTSADQNPTYSYAAEGTYTVCLTVTDVDGCSSTYCENVTVTDITTSIAQAVENGMTVYPNPSNGQFVVEVRGVEADVQLIVMDVAGRQIYSEGVVLNGSFRKSITLDVAKGSYILQVATLEGTVSRMIQVH